MPYGTVNADVIQSSVSGVSLGAGNASIMKNRIINGAMVIDQRNAGASVTNVVGAAYSVDRWTTLGYVASKFTAQQSATAPVGFNNSLLATSSSAYTVGASEAFALAQYVEGFNFADMNWGTANAKTVTLSFQVYSSLTGTFGGALRNSADNRSYPFSYSVPTANTWTTISVTIAGDTSGTWVGATNGVGVRVLFSLGAGSTFSGTAGSWSANQYFSATGTVSVVGTSGATFYITGVQLEVGSSATGFEYRQYQQELALCQRYFALTPIVGTGIANGATACDFVFAYPVQMRATPTYQQNVAIAITDSITADYTQSAANISSVISSGSTSVFLRFGNFTGLTSGKVYLARNANMFTNISAEL